MVFGHRGSVSPAEPDDVLEGMTNEYATPGTHFVLDHLAYDGGHAGTAQARLTLQEMVVALAKYSGS